MTFSAPSTLLEGGVGVGGGVNVVVLSAVWNTHFLRLVKVIIRMLQPFLCFFYSLGFIYLFSTSNFYPVTRFLVTPLLLLIIVLQYSVK